MILLLKINGYTLFTSLHYLFTIAFQLKNAEVVVGRTDVQRLTA